MKSTDNGYLSYSMDTYLTFIFYNRFVLRGRYELKGKARTRPDILRVVLGSCEQIYPLEASEQKWGLTPKSKPKREIFLEKTSNSKKKSVKIG